MSDTTNSADSLQRFSFDNTNIRGELAHVNASYREVLKRHQYPTLIAKAVGELMSATALLSANLKFTGRLTLQIRLPGNISLLQAETSDKGQLRAIARYEEGTEESELSFADGQMIITIEPEVGQRYQGITLIKGGNVAGALEDYFEQSEQLSSRFWLACDGQNAAGFMLQQMPSEQGDDPDAWDRLSHLASTIKDEELINLNNEVLLHRLYHEEQVRTYPASELSFFCTCSKDRIGNALHQLGKDELMQIIEEQGKISINCDFCKQAYSFDKEQVNELFPEQNLQ
ncbi:Hsp33 family molecular chaperone HslO [Thalassolituus sp. UBA3500]|uniref:Hsp33 family molecular chaperone HslO n=1 Tax=Thalassolituus sp. UBA3500 TaxID=1947664 RepID=UPI000C10F653|nr:Hsp33 family molecular chaperone HslO [Thalassolituus sp. UBA3500]MBN56440.1 Hsp33 family molecular chaperone HslO [Oceanospirillaceae bacterium]|tara:strand:- start:1441 stop:2298 length:858 start_codon:yes stop_codon:yes gene_type:complete